MTKIFTHSLPDAHPKHWQLLSEHAKQVALLAKGFAGKFGAASLGGVAGSLHDVGKYSDEF